MSLPILKSVSAVMRGKDGKLSFPAIALIGTSIVLICAFAVFFLVIPRIDERQRELEAERKLKERQLDELTLEKEFLQEISSLSKSREYLIRYLRETQGYIMNGDIRIDLNDPNAFIPTPVPTEEPETEDPEVSE